MFDRDQGGDIYKIFLNDLSPAPKSYQLFHLIEGIDLTFDLDGDYRYRAFQMPDQNDTDESRGLLVEIGKMRVIEAQAQAASFEINTQSEVFNG